MPAADAGPISKRTCPGSLFPAARRRGGCHVAAAGCRAEVPVPVASDRHLHGIDADCSLADVYPLADLIGADLHNERVAEF